MRIESGDTAATDQSALRARPRTCAGAADMRRRFKFLGDTGTWRRLTSMSLDIG